MNLYKYLLLLCLSFLFACKKEIKNPPNPPPEPTEEDQIRADIYDYFNKYSLWTAQIPDLDEQGRLDFVTTYSSNQSLLTALKNMTPYYAGYKGSIDRFSFLDEFSAEGNVSYADGFRMDTDEGYGLYFFWGLLTEEAKEWARPVIYFVEGGSPGHQKGIKRGSIVLAINATDDDGIQDTRVAVVKRGSEYYLEDVAAAERIHDAWYAAMEKPMLTLKLKTAENAINDYPLNHASSYEIDPVILDSVYTYPDKNIGYLAYSSFEEVWPTTHSNYIKLQNIFNSFKDANIKDLILDLRYNTGGYVSTAEYLANKMVNAADHGKLMFKYEVNDHLATSLRYKSDFQDVYFDNSNNQLALENVYILATEQTASASELLISALKPYLNVVLITETDRTYGKPVGFFPEEITDNVTLWVTSFKTINADGYTDYWDGMEVDVEGVNDYIFKDFGDPEEDMIAKALDLAGVSATTSSMRASSRMGTSAQRGVKLGIINKPRERNMLKTK